MIDLLAAWDANPSRELHLSALASTAARQLDSHAGHYMDGVERQPTVEVYAALQRRDQLTVYFVFDFMIFHHAQSGADWSYHHLHLGEVVFAGRALVSESVSAGTDILIQERDCESYDPIVAMRQLKDAARTALLKCEASAARG